VPINWVIVSEARSIAFKFRQFGALE